jgi:hypothetical protein
VRGRDGARCCGTFLVACTCCVVRNQSRNRGHPQGADAAGARLAVGGRPHAGGPATVATKRPRLRPKGPKDVKPQGDGCNTPKPPQTAAHRRQFAERGYRMRGLGCAAAPRWTEPAARRGGEGRGGAGRGGAGRLESHPMQPPHTQTHAHTRTRIRTHAPRTHTHSDTHTHTHNTHTHNTHTHTHALRHARTHARTHAHTRTQGRAPCPPFYASAPGAAPSAAPPPPPRSWGVWRKTTGERFGAWRAFVPVTFWPAGGFRGLLLGQPMHKNPGSDDSKPNSTPDRPRLHVNSACTSCSSSAASTGDALPLKARP